MNDMRMNGPQFGATYRYQLDDKLTESLQGTLSSQLDELGMATIQSEHLVSGDELDLLSDSSTGDLLVEFDADEKQLKLRTDITPDNRTKDLKAILGFLKSLNMPLETLKLFQKSFPDNLTEDVSEIALAHGQPAKVLSPSASSGNGIQQKSAVMPQSVYDHLFKILPEGNLERIKQIFDENPGIDINATSTGSYTLLYNAVKSDNPDVFDFFWNAPGIYKDKNYIENFLFQALNASALNIFEHLLKMPEFDVNKMFEHQTVLTRASNERNSALVSMILKHPEVNVNDGLSDYYGATALANTSSSDIVDQLLAQDEINPNLGYSSGKYYQTPLHVSLPNPAKIKALLTHPETVPFMPDSKGKTALSYFDYYSSKDSKKLLKEAGCDFTKYKLKESKEDLFKKIEKLMVPKKIEQSKNLVQMEKLLYHPNLKAEDIAELIRLYSHIDIIENMFEIVQTHLDNDTLTWKNVYSDWNKVTSCYYNFEPVLLKALVVKTRMEKAKEALTQK